MTQIKRSDSSWTKCNPSTQEGCGPAGNADCFSNYWVLETDYESYTVIYSCVEILELRNEFAWVLTREQNADPALVSMENVQGGAGGLIHGWVDFNLDVPPFCPAT